MTLAIETLPDDAATLKELLLKELKARDTELEKRDIELKRKDARIVELEELVRFFKARQFARKSEAYIHPGQGTLFNEVEAEVQNTRDEEKENQTVTYIRSKPKRKPLPPHLPRQDIVYELDEEQRQCRCGACLTEIGQEVSEQLDVIPAQYRVLRHIRKKYACRSCQEGVQTAAMPAQPIPKSNASPGLLAYIATSKYVDGLPLYRIENIFSRLGCDIPRSTQANWMIRLGDLFTPLLNLLREELVSGAVLHADETTLQVLKEKGRQAAAKSFMWVLARGDPGRKVVMFHYDPSRSSAVAHRITGDFSGYLLTDGYEGYTSIGLRPDVTHCGCWDHARRKFHDAIKGRSKDAKPGLADEGLYWINRLYDVERRAKGATSQRRMILRDLYSRGIIKHLEKWKNSVIDTVPPKSLVGKALQYLDSQWSKLKVFLTDGQIPLSNALAENAIRPFALGRKAWLFADTPQGAEASAAIYSIVETAKANDVEPYAYLRHVIEHLPRATTEADITALLPWNAELSAPN